jgi:predicted GNAT family acetyltransferase
MDAPTIEHAQQRRRYEIRIGKELAGFTRYHDDGNQRTFMHTQVEPDYEGHGLATQLIEWALADTRKAGLRISAFCPVVAAYLAKHPEYDDIVDALPK